MDFFGIGAGILGGIGQTMVQNEIQKRRQAEQFRQQKKLMDIQHQNQMKLNEQGKALALEQWNDTNYGAQLEHMKKAGLSVGLMYGQGGGGGTTANAGSGGSAAGGQAPSFGHMDINVLREAKELALLEAQKENIEADTKSKEADANLKADQREGQWLQNVVTKLGFDDMTKENIYRDAKSGETLYLNPESKVAKMWKAETMDAIQRAKSAITENQILEAEKVIKEFEADLTEQGIHPQSPWYMKLLTDVLIKSGIIDWLKK